MTIREMAFKKLYIIQDYIKLDYDWRLYHIFRVKSGYYEKSNKSNIDPDDR
jgi:hypothetical protein